MKQVLSGNGIPQCKLLFPPVIRVGDSLFLLRQASVDKERNIISGTLEEGCRRSFENIRKTLNQVSVGFEDIVQVRNYIGRQEHLYEFNNTYKEYFSASYPASATIMGYLIHLLKIEADIVTYKRQS